MPLTRVTGSVDDPDPKLDSVAVGDTETTVVIDGVTYDVLSSVHTEGATDLGGMVEHRHSDTAAFGSHFMLARSRGAEGAETIVANGDVLGRIVSLAYDGVSYQIAAEIRTEIDGVPGAGDVPTKMVIATTPDGAKSPVDRVTIGQDGLVTVLQSQTVTGNQSIGAALKSWGTDFKVSGISNSKVEYVNTVTGETGTAHWCYHNGTNWVYVDSVNDARRYYVLGGEKYEPYAASGVADATIVFDPYHHNEAWITPTFLNSWVNFGGTDASLQYKKDADGTVTVKGAVKNGTLNTAVFTLPVGYRPTEGVISAQGQNASIFCRVNVSPAGVVQQVGGASTVYLTLNITFKAEA